MHASGICPCCDGPDEEENPDPDEHQPDDGDWYPDWGGPYDPRYDYPERYTEGPI